jgi:molecular chaperone DnaK (HSP70)
MSEKWHKVIGIDLGTTYSAVAAYNLHKGQVEIIKNPESDNPETTPSVVSLHPTAYKAFVGSAAKRNLAQYPADTIIEVKREMGEDFRPETLVKFNAHGTFNQGDPVKVRFGNRDWMLPQEISAFTLMKMKEIAEREIGEEIRDAVVTVPAYFKEKQKKATEEAALLAGLYPRQLIPEPTAAAICYGVESGSDERKLYLVYDLGGGTFDVSIIEVQGSKLEVIATAGDPRLGGGDFDDAITRWTVGELARAGINVASERAILAKIKDKAEMAKIGLSLAETSRLDLTFLKHPTLTSLELSRPVFIGLIEPLLTKSLASVNEALELAKGKGVDRSHIDAILLVGGSSKIPRVKQLLLDFFQKDESFVQGDLNVDTVVARGAAMMAHRFGPSPAPFDIRQRKQQAQLMNAEAEVQDVRMITEHSLGIDTDGGRFAMIVQRGTNIPIKVRREGFTNGGPAPTIPVGVFQGEDKSVYNNTLIGTLNIGPMEPRPPGFHQFAVEFNLDINGLLTMVVHHLNENKSYQAKFDQKTGVGGDDALIAMRAKLLDRYASAAVMSSMTAGVVPPPQGPYVPQGPGYPPPGVGYAPPAPPPPSPMASGMPAYPAPSVHQPGVWTPQPQQPPSPGPTAAGWAQQPPGQPAPPVGYLPPGAAPSYPAPTPPPGYPQAPSYPPPPAYGHQPPGSGQPAPNAWSTGPFNPSPGTPPAPAPLPISPVPTVIEAQVPVPEQFKQTVRRAHKQLLRRMNPALLEAFNAFSTALNSGVTGSALEEIGDNLADAFDQHGRD